MRRSWFCPRAGSHKNCRKLSRVDCKLQALPQRKCRCGTPFPPGTPCHSCHNWKHPSKVRRRRRSRYPDCPRNWPRAHRHIHHSRKFARPRIFSRKRRSWQRPIADLRSRLGTSWYPRGNSKRFVPRERPSPNCSSIASRRRRCRRMRPLSDLADPAKRIAPKVSLSVQCEPESRSHRSRDHGDDDEGEHAARGAALGAMNTWGVGSGTSPVPRSRRPAAGGQGRSSERRRPLAFGDD